MSGIKENLENLRLVAQKHISSLWGASEERLRVAAIEGMRHRNDPKMFEQRAEEVDDLTSTMRWLEELSAHMKAMPTIRQPHVTPKPPEPKPAKPVEQKPTPLPQNHPKDSLVIPPSPHYQSQPQNHVKPENEAVQGGSPVAGDGPALVRQ